MTSTQMTSTLKRRLIEADHPVGCKPVNNWKLPPSDFAFGKKEKDDEFHAGASIFLFKSLVVG